MVRRALAWVASRLLSPPRVIFDSEDRSPYLSRYYLIGAPIMPDGSTPFDRDGTPKWGAIWPSKKFGVYLHRFHRGDEDADCHSHPWLWACSLILAGGYREERRRGNVTTYRDVKPLNLNFLFQDSFHRVELLDGECWSLFIVGPRTSGWGFWRDGRVIPWREYINARRDPTAFARIDTTITPEQRATVRGFR